MRLAAHIFVPLVCNFGLVLNIYFDSIYNFFVARPEKRYKNAFGNLLEFSELIHYNI